MRLACGALLFSFTFGSPALAQHNDLNSRLTDLVKATQLDAKDNPPFHLKIDAQLYDLAGKPTQTGTIEEWWLSPDEFRIEINSGSVQSVIATGVDDGPQAVFTRERYLLNHLLSETLHPLSIKGAIVQSEGPRSFGHATLQCLQFSSVPIVGSAAPPSLACTSASTGNVLTILQSPELVARESVGKFHDTQVSLNIKILYGGIVAIEGKVAALQTISPGQPDLPTIQPQTERSVVSGAAVQDVKFIPGLSQPRRISKQAPHYPESARYSHIQGTVLMDALISKEGKVTNWVVVASPDESLSEASIDAVKQWTYEPYRLNGQPIDMDTVIRVNFNLNP
jgi:TonB family protein